MQAVHDTIVSTQGRNQQQASQDSSDHDLPMLDQDSHGADGILPEINCTEENPTAEGSKDDEVARLKATIAELTKQSNNKGVVRQPPPFEEEHRKTGANVKTRSIADVGKSGNPSSVTTRNKSKTEKVRTRADGPSETLEVMGSGSKKSKKKKVATPIDDTTENAHDLVSLNGEPQPPPAKVKRTSKK